MLTIKDFMNSSAIPRWCWVRQQSKKTTKSKDDKAHPGQLEYTHWINCINDSSAIMRWYGLAPFVKGMETVKQMIPDLQTLVKHFIAQNKDMTKVKCTDLASNMFGSSASFVSSVNLRVLKTIKFYAKPRSLLVFLKLFLAYALKRHKKTTPFLAGGV